MCHINHRNSLADFWIPLLVCAGLTLILTFATFAYCVRVYLASLSDSGAATTGYSGVVPPPPPLPPSSSPHYTNSIRTLTPSQAYHRIRRVVQHQWRGITIVLIIITDIIFFSVVFVFQDSNIQDARNHLEKAQPWILCLIQSGGNKNKCLAKARDLAVSQGTIAAVLFLMALNGIWLLLLLGKKDMARAWPDLIKSTLWPRRRIEFVSVDTRIAAGAKERRRSYEMLSSPSSPLALPLPVHTRRAESQHQSHPSLG